MYKMISNWLGSELSQPENSSPRKTSTSVNFQVTMWPDFPHFPVFAKDDRIQGIRLNSAMIEASEIGSKFEKRVKKATVPCWFDAKGMQMRIREVVCDHNHDHLEFILNRPVKAKTPFVVHFKAGEDAAKCVQIRNGNHFIFEGGPRYQVRSGESIHIRSPHEAIGPVFLDYEIEKLEKIKAMNFNNYYLSYVYDQRHVDEFREIIGKDANLYLKIENQEGLKWVADKWKPQENTHLAAARGDLYVEVDRPHEIMNACKLIIQSDPDAIVGSRMMLSVVKPPVKSVEFFQYFKNDYARDAFTDEGYDLIKQAAENYKAMQPKCNPIPRCADLSDLSWLYDIGYRNFLLCDEICLNRKMLGTAVSIFDNFRSEYARDIDLKAFFKDIRHEEENGTT